MGRQLESFDGIAYTYNENGIRTSKTVNGVTTRYYLDGTNIIAQTDGTTTVYFRYDSNGELTGLAYNGADYFYVKNLQGDITAIADSTGTVVAAYTYDPWGAVLSVTGTNTTLANLNPFRYRGYCYDSETGLFYKRRKTTKMKPLFYFISFILYFLLVFALQRFIFDDYITNKIVQLFLICLFSGVYVFICIKVMKIFIK